MSVLHTLRALANFNRLKILHHLRKRPHSVGELAQDLKISRSAVTQHLHVLDRAGLVRYQPKWHQPAYSIVPEGFDELRKYLEDYE